MQTLIDPFELHASKFIVPEEPVSGKHLVADSARNLRATLMDVDEIAWFAETEWEEDEVTLELDLEEDLPRRAVVPRGRGARVWTSEE